jgi:hypothetical protein
MCCSTWLRKTVHTVFLQALEPHCPTQAGTLSDAFGGIYLQWALQAPNTPPISAEKQQVSPTDTSKNAAPAPETNFAAAVASIMALPLTDSEKAEAVRRLLRGKEGETP